MELTDEKLIDLLAEGYKGPEIQKMYDILLYTFERRMERLKTKHKCRTVTQLVVKLKLSGGYTTDVQPNY